jgi:shikimate dehydrogenase
MRVDASTVRLGVVGHPVSHSMSPAIWNATFAEENRNAVFVAYDVEPSELAGFVAGFRLDGGRGLNVTLPHKGAALELATARSAEAAAVGAANVLVLDGESTHAHNTDVIGVRGALAELGVPSGCSVLVVGAGGAGRAAAHAVAQDAREVLVTNRTASRAMQLAEAVGGRAVGWEDRDDAARACDVIVQSTSLGLTGEGLPIAAEALRGGPRYVLDLVYGADETPFVHIAREAGLLAADGLSMLVHQAAEAWRLFLGGDPPASTLRRVAFDVAGRTLG